MDIAVVMEVLCAEPVAAFPPQQSQTLRMGISTNGAILSTISESISGAGGQTSRSPTADRLSERLCKAAELGIVKNARPGHKLPPDMAKKGHMLNHQQHSQEHLFAVHHE
jgi:hypothetical protein